MENKDQEAMQKLEEKITHSEAVYFAALFALYIGPEQTKEARKSLSLARVNVTKAYQEYFILNKQGKE